MLVLCTIAEICLFQKISMDEINPDGTYTTLGDILRGKSEDYCREWWRMFLYDNPAVE